MKCSVTVIYVLDPRFLVSQPQYMYTRTPVKAKHLTLTESPHTQWLYWIIAYCISLRSQLLSLCTRSYIIIQLTCHDELILFFLQLAMIQTNKVIDWLKCKRPEIKFEIGKRKKTRNNLHSFSRNTQPIVLVYITDVCICLYFSVNEDYRRQDFGNSSC